MRFFKNFVPAVLLSLSCSFAAFSQTSSRPIVDLISAKPVSTNKIKITWKLPKDFEAEAILIYKSTMPFNSRMISESAPLAQLSPKTSSYIDTVINYKEYYYAVIARVSDGSLYNIVLPSLNATVKGVRVERPVKKSEPSDEELERQKEKVYPKGIARELPLPYIDLISDIDRKPTLLSPQVMAAGNELAQGYSKPIPDKLSPYYFEEDIVSPAGGDDYFLFEILKNYFVKKDYKNSVKALHTFLGVNRSEDTTNRAMFYLAQSQYFIGNYRNALQAFLYIEDAYPVLSKKWINSTLDFYTIPQN